MDGIHNTSFSLLTNGPKKLDCYIAIAQKGWEVINTLACWAHSEVLKKMNCCEYNRLFTAVIYECS